MLAEVLSPNYKVRFATNGNDALDIARSSNPPRLILLDVMMPDMDGYEVCHILKASKETASIPVIFITSLTDDQDESKGFEYGAVDYITKPFNPAIVKARVDTHITLTLYNTQLEEIIIQRTSVLTSLQKDIVHRLGLAAECRDYETGQHIKRLSNYCRVICEELGMSKSEQILMMQASTLHDVGKIGIPDHILLKPGKLTPAEFEIMKTHTTLGGDLLDGSSLEIIEMSRMIALTHHEKWDGRGYPHGLKGKDIPTEGRVVAVCDVFDALISVRPYKKAWSPEEALKELRLCAGTQFDPNIVDLFEARFPEILGFCTRFAE